MNRFNCQVNVHTTTALLADELIAIQARENALELEYGNLQIEQLKIDRAKQAVKADRDRLQIQRLEILSRLQEFSNELSLR
jgi:cell division protein FtsL